VPVGPGNGSKSFSPRRARPEEARTIADVWLRSRHASIPADPAPRAHDDAVREWFASVLVWTVSYG